MKSPIQSSSANNRTPTARTVLCLAFAGLASISASAANLVNNGDFANMGNVFVANVPSFGGDDPLTGGGTNIPS